MSRLLPQWSSKLSSLIWRLLARYGEIKYHYLLPLYRRLHLMPDKWKAQGTGKPAGTLRYAQALTRALNSSVLSVNREQLQRIIERVEQSKGAVIFLPSIGWNLVNTQRSHHLAREFARQGYVSIFDCTNAYDDVNGFQEVAPNLFLFRAEAELLAEIPGPLLWSLTYNFDRRTTYPASTRIVYDWIDDLEVFPYDRQFLEANHAEALQEATAVISVARRLHEQASRVRPDALCLPNGADYQHFASDALALPDDPELDLLRQEGKPIVGYFGALAEWFDYEMLDEVAGLRSDWNFLLIGPVYDLSLHERGQALLKRKNVYWLGARPYAVLPAYLRLFDVAMIPFLINDITLATSPLKLYEYFAGGKPVIATALPECQAYAEVQIIRTAAEFSLALETARQRGGEPEFRDRLRLLGRENSWTARVQALVRHLNNM